jgi:hypothetical protein
MRHRCDEGESLDLEVIHLRNQVHRLEEVVEAMRADLIDIYALLNQAGPAVSVSIEASPIQGDPHD